MDGEERSTVEVAIIGAGIVGLACAYELNRRSATVCVADAGEPGAGASHGNTGWVAPSLSGPLAAPGIMREAAGWMLKGNGPLSIKPSLDPSYLSWLWRFARNCSATQFGKGLDAMVALNRRTLELFGEYRDDRLEFELHESGLVVAALTAEGLRPYADLFDELRRRGYDGAVRSLSSSEARALEPTLSETAVAGGLHARVDRYVRPESLARCLADRLRASGVPIRTGTAVESIARRNGLFLLQTAAAPIQARRVLIAAGTASKRLLRPFGLHIPVVGAKGYSVTLEGSDSSPKHALYLAEAKVGVSSYVDATRIAGRFELGGSGVHVERRHVEGLLKQSDPYFGGWRPSAQRRLEEWAGLRPATPDGLPLLGEVPGSEGIFVATGHGMLGVTLAPVTARLLAGLMLDGERAPELAPLRVDRRS